MRMKKNIGTGTNLALLLKHEIRPIMEKEVELLVALERVVKTLDGEGIGEVDHSCVDDGDLDLEYVHVGMLEGIVVKELDALVVMVVNLVLEEAKEEVITNRVVGLISKG